MRKSTFLFVALLAAMCIQAQTYNFSVSQNTYADLENSTSLSNGQVWDYDEFGPVTMPFAFSINGQAVTQFMFSDDYFQFLTANSDLDEGTGLLFIDASLAAIQDRTYSTGTSSSSVNYKVEGETGNSILKLEVKNAGLEDGEDLGFDEDAYFLSFQLWLYENGNAVEIRYGQNNITDLSVLGTEGSLWAGISDDANAYFAYGDSANPTYGEFTETTFPENGLSMAPFPANNTVYRFAPANTAGVKNVTAPAISLYPNPAATVLNLKSTDFASADYEIYDVMGKLVTANKMNTGNSDVQINVQNLNDGIYFVKTNGQYLKFVKTK